MADAQHQQHQQHPGANENHWIRDAVLSVVIAGSPVLAVPVQTARTSTTDPSTAQSLWVPAPERTTQEEADFAEAERIRHEQEQDKALELGTIMNSQAQVEERSDDRDER